MDPFPVSSEGLPGPADALISVLWPQKCETMKFRYFKTPHLWDFAMASQSELTQKANSPKTNYRLKSYERIKLGGHGDQWEWETTKRRKNQRL